MTGRLTHYAFRWMFAAVLLIAPLTLVAQELQMRCDPPEGSLGDLTKLQKQAFMKSQDQLLAGHFADALAVLRRLLAQVPENTPAHEALADRAGEAALYAGEHSYAITILRPLEERDGSNCPARTLLARAYAETGQSAERDAEIAALESLHAHSPNSPIGQLDTFLLEQKVLSRGGSVAFWYSLRPSGALHTHLVAALSDASGHPVLQVELNSDDGLQVNFKERHPELAAKGEREFSLDASRPDRLPDGSIDHATIQFFDGKPPYDAIRKRILELAERATKSGK